MARTATARARRPVLVHPASTSRIARASLELMGPLPGDVELPTAEILSAIEVAIGQFGVRPIIKALEERKAELMTRLVAMVERDGETDDKGKIRYETELHRFQVIEGANVHIPESGLKVAMTASGITPKTQATILRKCAKRTLYSYVGVYRKQGHESEVMS